MDKYFTLVQCLECGHLNLERYYEVDSDNWYVSFDPVTANVNRQQINDRAACEGCNKACEKVRGIKRHNSFVLAKELSDTARLESALDDIPCALKFVEHNDENIKKSLRAHGCKALKYLPAEKQLAYYEYLLEFDSSALSLFAKQTLPLVEKAVNFFPNALRFAKVSSKEIEAVALEKDWAVISFCQYPHLTVAQNIVKRHPKLYTYLPPFMQRDERIRIAAANSKPWEGYNYTWQIGDYCILPDIKQPSQQVVDAALATNPNNIKYAPHRTLNVNNCANAVRLHSRLIKFVPSKLKLQVMLLVKSLE